MNEELQNAVQELITRTLSGVDTTVDFLSAELPDYIYQLLLWYGIYNFMLFLTAIIFMVLYIWWQKHCHTWLYEKLESVPEGSYGEVHTSVRSTNENRYAAFWFISVFSFIGTGLVVGSTLNLTWLKIWIAPKVWLLEYAGSLVK